MVDADGEENSFSFVEEDELYEPIGFDPECTFVDEDNDSDTLAFRDAARDIWASEGQFIVMMP
jgi:hypothetical protein